MRRLLRRAAGLGLLLVACGRTSLAPDEDDAGDGSVLEAGAFGVDASSDAVDARSDASALDATLDGAASEASAEASVECPPPATGAASWTVTPAPVDGELRAVWATSRCDVWAVSAISVLHWDGSGWSIVLAPTSSLGGAGGLSVWASNAHDVWIGRFGSILHFDGAVWTETLQSAVAAVNGLSGISSNDVWAAGAIFVPHACQAQFRHWDGSQWSSPGALPWDNGWGDGAYPMQTVWATAAQGVWVGGAHCGASGLSPAIFHSDGASWSAVGTQPITSTFLAFGGAGTDVWALVGGPYGGTQNGIAHWNGATWDMAYAASTPTTDSRAAIWAAAPNSVWAAGGPFGGGILHWDGTTWAPVATPTVTQPNFAYYGALSGTSSKDVWAVGGTTIIHYAPP